VMNPALRILSSSACERRLADQIVMKNGDRITGTIVKLDGKNITVKTANLGAVTASWDQWRPFNLINRSRRSKTARRWWGKLAPAEGKE